MKTFEITTSKNGNILILDHHSKPSKIASIFNSEGVYLNDITVQQFDSVAFFEGRSQIKAISFQDAVLLLVNYKKKQKADFEAIVPGTYEVTIQEIPLQGIPKHISLRVNANSKSDAFIAAEHKYWANPKYDTVKIVMKFPTLIQ